MIRTIALEMAAVTLPPVGRSSVMLAIASLRSHPSWAETLHGRQKDV
jgi:hypothetical protein